jgi:hypothetical protein
VTAMSQDRRYTRIKTRLRANARHVHDPEALPLHTDSPEGAKNMARERLEKSNLQPALVEYLVSLDAKVDMLVSLYSRDRIVKDYPIDLEVVEISGSGIAFTSSESFTENDFVEVVLVLANYPVRMAAAVGQIVRAEKSHGQPLYAMDFTSIRESDLESIVQFVFQEERSLIRKNKWS